VRETSCLVAFYWANFLGKVLGNFLQVVAVFVNWTKKRKSEKAKKRKNEKAKKAKKGTDLFFQQRDGKINPSPYQSLISPCKPDG
jgi:hypothetical protein